MKCKECGKTLVNGACPGCSKKSMGQMMGMKQGMKKGMTNSKAQGKKSMPMGFMRGK
jgi:hypothetical protein